MSKEKLNEIYKLVKETGYVQSINMYREMDNDSTKEYNLILSLSTCAFHEGDTRIKLVFYNIQYFKLGNINNFYKVFFEIINVSGRQLENIRYYVNEIEYNMVSFWCSDIEYKSF